MDKRLNDFLPDASAPEGQTAAIGIQYLSDYMSVELSDIRSLFHLRKAFSHKGTYGHALIIAGGTLTMGAALLCAKGCLCAGAGLTTTAIPASGLAALNAALPEVMYVEKQMLLNPQAFDPYQAVAVGPGLSDEESNLSLLGALIRLKIPLVVDADGLNMISVNKKMLDGLAANSIITPHVKEFDRLFGAHPTWYARLQTAIREAKTRKIVIVLKNQFTFIVDRTGLVYINTTGNPAMAQGGMGDVLTGIITGLAAQGYPGKDAAILGCYLHGKSGDELAETYFNVKASQLAAEIPKTLKRLLKL